jgi:hypothetical protein
LKNYPQSRRKYLLAIYQTKKWQPEYTGSSKTRLPPN